LTLGCVNVHRNASLLSTFMGEFMKPTTEITLPASFIITVSHTSTASTPTAPADIEILTVAESPRLFAASRHPSTT